MSDFSLLFLAFELVKKLPNLTDFKRIERFGSIAIVISVLLYICSYFLRSDKHKDNAPDHRVIMRSLAAICAVFGTLLIVCSFLASRAFSIEDAANFFGGGVVPAVIVAILGLLTFVLFVFGILQPKRANLTGQLSIRQLSLLISGVTAPLLLIVALFFYAPTIYGRVFAVLLTVLELAAILLWCVDPVVFLITRLVRFKSRPTQASTPGKLNRFAVVCMANNAESIIANLIRSLHANSYPRNHFDVYVVCSNCADNTADAVRAAGATAMVRNDPNHRGRGAALEWMLLRLRRLAERGKVYDAYIILNADNLVNERYIDIVNNSLNEGYDFMQTYVGSKNAHDNWLTKSLSMGEWLHNNIFQLARSKCSLAVQTLGTGFVLRPSVLDEIEWDPRSFADDLVFSSRYILARGNSCTWIHDAKVYEERLPGRHDLSQQRTRRMQGHMDAMLRFAPQLVASAVRKRNICQLDAAIYLAKPILSLIILFCYALRALAACIFPQSVSAMPLIMNATSATIFFVLYLLIQLHALFEDHHLRDSMWLPVHILFSFSWYVPILRGIIKRRERYLILTTHSRNISIADVREDRALLNAMARLDGLDTLNKLPLGQILLKAELITEAQLDRALQFQQESGGFLGDVIVNMNALPPETLRAFLAIQEAIKRRVLDGSIDNQSTRLGNLLVDADVITQEQLELALDYQEAHGGFIGSCLVNIGCMSKDMLRILLELQKILVVNTISLDATDHFIENVMQRRRENIGTLLLHGGIITQQQLHIALQYQKSHGGQIGQILLDHGFISIETLDSVLAMQYTSRAIDSAVGGVTSAVPTATPEELR